MSKVCSQCGSEIAPDAAFCTNCGAKAPADNNTEIKEKEVKQEAAPAAQKCKKCGAELKDGVAFCTECGASSKDEPAPAATAEVKTQAPPPPVQEQRQQQPPPQQTPIQTQAPPVQQARPQPQPQPQPQYTQQPPQGQPVYQNQPPYQQQAYGQPQYQQPAYHHPQQTYQPQPTYAAPPPAPKDESGGVVSTGTFFGTMLLFALPFIGFISCIIMCFAPKRKSLKNYAKANLIWAIIGLVFGLLLVGGIFLLGGSLMDYLSEAMGGELGDLSGLQ